MKQVEGGEVKQVARDKMPVAARGEIEQAVRGKENLAVDYRATRVEERFFLAQGWAPHETNKWRAGHFPLALQLEEGHLS